MLAIFGANGKVGSATAHQLRKDGFAVRAVVRDLAAAEPLAKIGCELCSAELDDESQIAQALDGTQRALIMCPLNPLASDPLQDASRLITAIGEVLRRKPLERVVAISDYGADREEDTGVTLVFRKLEERLRSIDLPLVLLRSSEQMENLARVLPAVIAKAILPSFHHPLTKLYPTVSGQDVGKLAAELLVDSANYGNQSAPVLHIEGPSRYSALDVAATLSDLAGLVIQPVELPRDRWFSTLSAGRMSPKYAELIGRTFDAHNAGLIGVENGGEVHLGQTNLREAMLAILEKNPMIGAVEP
jgi:NAD(P)H dehydrogenase (quinone)